MHSCRNTEEKLIDLLFGELDSEGAASVRAELSQCPRCQAQWQEMKATLHCVEQAEETLKPQENYWPGYESRLRVRLADDVSSPAKAASWLSWLDGLRWLPSLPMTATAIAVLLLGFGIWWWSQPRTRTNDEIVRATPAPTASPVVTQMPSDNVTGDKANNDEQKNPDKKSDSGLNSAQPHRGGSNRNHSRNQPRSNSRLFDVEVNSTAPMSDLQIEVASPIPTQADPARHFEKAQLLLRSFRNANVDEGGQVADLSYERQQSRKLVYDNILLRRDAAAKGNLPVADVLNDLEPLLLDIANLPDKPSAGEIKAIRDRVQKQEMVATLQVYTNVVASLGND